MPKRKSTRGNYEIEELEDIELSPELGRRIEHLTKAAEDYFKPVRVNFRWQLGPLEFVQDVAAAMGVPYQTYMKQVLYQQAMDDFERISKRNERARTPKSPSRKPSGKK